jgi:tRNA threonylcarbamoyladenosine modification (KEOPS) complex  Pcc1 subunit
MPIQPSIVMMINPMKTKAKIRLKFSSEKQLDAVVAALTPEAEKPLAGRAEVTLERQDDFLVLHVAARDTVALRSTLNAYLRWVGSVVNVVDVLERSS